MTFQEVYRFGDHKIVSYDIHKHPFREYFEALYNTNDLEHLHTQSIEYESSTLMDIETSLHKQFYNDIKTNHTFKKLYCEFIKEISTHFYQDQEWIIYQSFPSIRFQFINNMAVPPHYDSDDIGRHPLGERNFLLPITSMYNTNRLFIESHPGSSNFEGMTMNYGNLLLFNGNRCTHFNKVNIESILRISLDFRVIHLSDYLTYLKKGQITQTNPRDPDKCREPIKMVIGGYYQIANRSDTVDHMMKWQHQKELLLQTRPNFDIAEATACFEYMKDGTNFVTEYQQTTKLEKMLSEFIGVKHVIMTTSGSMALIMALLGANIGSGDDVIVPDYTMIATINAVKFVGANPIIVDVDKCSHTITVETIKSYCTSNTKCVIHVSLNNRSIDLSGVAEYCLSNHITLIEDAAQSLGATVNGKHYGTFGKIGCFSLSTPKIISTGQGGFVVTDDDHIASKMSMIKNFGRKCGGVDLFEVFGLNMKFTDIQAVIGIEQVKKLPDRIQFMRSLYRDYYEQLHDLPLHMIAPIDDTYLPWFIDIYTPHRDELAIFLKAHNIQTRPTYPEIHRTPMYLIGEEYPITTYISNTGLFLPSHTLLKKEDVRFICRLIRVFFTPHTV